MIMLVISARISLHWHSRCSGFPVPTTSWPPCTCDPVRLRLFATCSLDIALRSPSSCTPLWPRPSRGVARARRPRASPPPPPGPRLSRRVANARRHRAPLSPRAVIAYSRRRRPGFGLARRSSRGSHCLP